MILSGGLQERRNDLQKACEREKRAMQKICQKCGVTYIGTKQIRCDYCFRLLKTISSQGMCPNISLKLLEVDMAGCKNLYFGVH